MKTKFLWVALLGSAALIAQAQAGGRYGGGGGAHFAAAHSGSVGRGASSFRSAPMRGFGGGRVYSSQAFSRSASPPAFGQHSINANNGAFIRSPQLSQAKSERTSRLARSSNQRTQAVASSRHAGTRADPVRRGNSLPPNWRNHVVAQHSANWHRDWDRGHEHWWNGHRCRFVNGSWFIFDSGFYPWSPYWYPDEYYYGYQPYPYYYGQGYDDSGYSDSGVYQGQVYNDQGSGYGMSGADADSMVTAAQEQLAREGYYRGEIDGKLGPQTRRAITRFQSGHGLRVTGYLSADTLRALGLQTLARN
ncbi:MAG TPA: peptidoglycan-binding domain-containing protein [Chthoniobacterales bacterium]